MRKRNQYEFDKRKYDHVHLQVKKGEREEMKSHAAHMGESMNGFINRAIAEALERDEKKYALQRRVFL